MKPDDLATASTATAARLFRLTTTAVDRWRIEEITEAEKIWRKSATKRTGGKAVIEWDLPALLAWKIARITAAAAKSAPASKELDPLEKEHLHRLQTENAKRDGLLVNRVELERQWAVVGAELRQRLEAIGRRHGMEASADIAKALSSLSREVNGILGDPA